MDLVCEIALGGFVRGVGGERFVWGIASVSVAIERVEILCLLVATLAQWARSQ